MHLLTNKQAFDDYCEKVKIPKVSDDAWIIAADRYKLFHVNYWIFRKQGFDDAIATQYTIDTLNQIRSGYGD